MIPSELTADNLLKARRSISVLLNDIRQVESDFVRVRVEPFLCNINVEIENYIRLLYTEKSRSIFWIRVDGPDSKRHFLELDINATFTHLKEQIKKECKVEIETQLLSAPNISFNVPDRTPLAHMGIGDKSIITLKKFHNVIQIERFIYNARNRILQSGIRTRSLFESLALTVHALLLEIGFLDASSIESLSKNGPTSISATSERISDRLLIGSDWNYTPGIISFSYKSPISDSIHKLELHECNGSCIAQFFGKDGYQKSANFSMAEYEAAELAIDPRSYYLDLFQRLKEISVDEIMVRASVQVSTKDNSDSIVSEISNPTEEPEHGQLIASITPSEPPSDTVYEVVTPLEEPSMEPALTNLATQAMEELRRRSFKTREEARAAFGVHAKMVGFTINNKKKTDRTCWLSCACAGKPTLKRSDASPFIKARKRLPSIRKECKWKVVIKRVPSTRLGPVASQNQIENEWVVSHVPESFHQGHSHPLVFLGRPEKKFTSNAENVEEKPVSLEEIYIENEVIG